MYHAGEENDECSCLESVSLKWQYVCALFKVKCSWQTFYSVKKGDDLSEMKWRAEIQVEKKCLMQME